MTQHDDKPTPGSIAEARKHERDDKAHAWIEHCRAILRHEPTTPPDQLLP